MASLGHIAVGMAAARVYETERPGRRASIAALVFWSLLSMLPDADVIGFGFGVRYQDEWGHRGATHSLLFSLALGVAIGLVAPLFRQPVTRTAVAATLVLASHALLDTLTNGGLGIALLWPFDLTRYFAPWNPIPVAPIGLNYFSPYGLMVAATELLLFAPLFWFGLMRTGSGFSRTSVRAVLFGIWVIIVWLLVSHDPVRERVVGAVLRDETQFTRDFSEDLLNTITQGDTERDVRGRLGAPFYEFLLYPDNGVNCVQIRLENDAVMGARPPELCRARGVAPATTRATVIKTLGLPEGACWLYSRSPRPTYYRGRAVCFEGGRVTFVVKRWMRD